MFQQSRLPITPTITKPHARDAKRWTRTLCRAVRRGLYLMRPTLVSLAFMAAGSVAHAQGTMDFSGADTLMQTFKTSAMDVGQLQMPAVKASPTHTSTLSKTPVAGLGLSH